ncbi:hypothetical protein H5410_047079 [Solanum commersonii]|uniref:Uncharacterized protein n=1 Tax=Solanum commersonii TaxID=4109 RepID=A0A9J5XG27_SOLCO|nr:hypothetical protein H5410_047079 [Solanum commersonii]
MCDIIVDLSISLDQRPHPRYLNLSLGDNLSIKSHFHTCIMHHINEFTFQILYHSLCSILLGLFKNANGCMSDSPKIVYFWRIRDECGIKSEESAQLRTLAQPEPFKL